MYCQKLFNAHRLSFIDALALKPWENGLQAKCTKKEGGKQMVFCTVLNVNNDDKTCSVDFGASVVRHDVPLSDLRAVKENATVFQTR